MQYLIEYPGAAEVCQSEGGVTWALRGLLDPTNTDKPTPPVLLVIAANADPAAVAAFLSQQAVQETAAAWLMPSTLPAEPPW